jgi:peptidoglycan hydrolase CwlO-like protein
MACRRLPSKTTGKSGIFNAKREKSSGIPGMLDNVSDAVREAIARVIDAPSTPSPRRASRSTSGGKQISDITTEQTRIRDNMRAVAQSTDYYARLLKKLDEQETQIESLQKQAGELQKQLDSQQRELEKRVGELTLG